MNGLARTCCCVSLLAFATDISAQTVRYPTTQYRSYRPAHQSSYSRLPTTRNLPASRKTSSPTKRAKAPYRLGVGDTVAVIVQGVTGEFSKAPVHMPKVGDGTLPAVGHPMVVLRDGTLPMPLISPVSVTGMTVTQARDAVSQAYLHEEILNNANQVTLGLMRKRTVSVNVLHDNPSLAMRGLSKVALPADQANVLSALVGSGSFDRDASVSVVKARGQQVSSRSRLSDGDTVHVQSRPTGRFFTGGRLRGGQYEIPASRPLNVLQAISVAGGVPSTGGLQQFLGPREVVIVRRGGGTVRMGYSQLLNNPGAVMIRSGDTLIVR